MQKRRDAETAARKAQEQAAAAARAAERRARVLGSTELTPDGVALLLHLDGLFRLALVLASQLCCVLR